MRLGTFFGTFFTTVIGTSRCALVTPEPVLTASHPISQCVDMRKTFGTRFKYTWDPAFKAERPEWRKVEAPWLTRIACRHGWLMPWGGTQLAAYCCAGAVKRSQLEQLKCVQIAQGGGNDLVGVFDVKDLDAVLAVMRARKPRRYSVEERARRTARLVRARGGRKVAKTLHTGGLVGLRSPERVARQPRGYPDRIGSNRGRQVAVYQ